MSQGAIKLRDGVFGFALHELLKLRSGFPSYDQTEYWA